MVRLYNKDLQFVDWGVPSKADTYTRMGYIVEFPIKRRKKDEDNS